MRKHNLSAIMKRAWEIKNENAENIFSECLKMAWAEAKTVKKTLPVSERKITRTIPYRVYKSIDRLADGVEVKRGEYHKSDKTIDITMTFDERFFLVDYYKNKVDSTLLEKFNSTDDSNIVFACEMREAAEKAGVTSRFVLDNSCNYDADEWIAEMIVKEANKGRNTAQYEMMQEVRKNIFCVEAIG